MATNRPRGYRDWNPQVESQTLIGQIQEVLETYASYLPLTLRQVFYRLVGKYDYEKTERAYGRLGDAVNRAHREPRGVWWKIPWDVLREHLQNRIEAA